MQGGKGAVKHNNFGSGDQNPRKLCPKHLFVHQASGTMISEGLQTSKGQSFCNTTLAICRGDAAFSP
ncbi:hypothetical protein AA0313_1709 [Acetobacter indonesiensis NRIC 0313]|nr:hypothetical protein AA0313_1709 [Acetobacter indonesiensis NRIC 0313]